MTRVGILGGLGPAAGADFYSRMIAATPAKRDQEHVPVVMWADPTMPDRTGAYLGSGPGLSDPLEQAVAGLAAAGADFIVSPCNTIHIWLPATAARQEIELVSIVTASADAAAVVTRSGTAIGILATGPTLDSGIYSTALGARNRRVIAPGPAEQDDIIDAIYAIKSGSHDQRHRAVDLTVKAVERLAETGVAAVISACTETSLALTDIDLPVPLIDSTDALVAATIGRWQELSR